MFDLSYEIEFFSSWHCGSGMGGGKDADFCPLLDTEGFPFVPGKTLKGLFRNASEVLHDKDFTARIFGLEGIQNGQALWSNAELQAGTREYFRAAKNVNALKEMLHTAQYFIQIDENGQTKDKSLRRGEYIVPLKLYGTIRNLEESDLEKIRECMGFIKQLGLQRSRGFGRCKITALEVIKNEAKVPTGFCRKNEYYFKCKFLSEVILNTTGATQGALDTLEYIPGSNFLGITGRQYSTYGENAFDVFHSGKVRFGNAYPLSNGQTAALPCPANWFIPKGKTLSDPDTVIYWNSQDRASVQSTKQPKQVRGGYFVPGSKPAIFSGEISKSFSLKSAYDSDKRKSDDHCMFGYTALNAGSEWTFTVKFDSSLSDKDVEQIVNGLLGHHGIGRSKSSQYGTVEISLLKDNPLCNVSSKNKDGVYYLYALSSAAFLNEYGEPALLPPVQEFGFSGDAYYDMEETQIRYQSYCPWNGARKSRDAERLMLLPGSVIAIRSTTAPDESVLKRGVGLYRSEGCGEFLCNPDFLFCNQLICQNAAIQERPQKTADSKQADQELLNYLKQKLAQEQTTRQIYRKVTDFVYGADGRAYKKVTPSQWGAIRAIAIASADFNELLITLFAQEEEREIPYEERIKNSRASHSISKGYLRHGTCSKLWKNGLADHFEKNLLQVQKEFGSHSALIYTQLLCAEMAKMAAKEKKKS